MSDFEQYLDIQHPERFEPLTLNFDEAPRVTAEGGGFLLKGVEGYITSDVRCAREFLRAVRDGEVEFGRQQRVVRVLLELSQRVHSRYTNMAELRVELGETLALLGDRIPEFMRAQGSALTLERDGISEAFGLGGNSGAIHYTLSIARSAALTAFIQAFCRLHTSSKPPSDLCGSWHLVISEPKDADYAASFEGSYGSTAVATIRRFPKASIWRAGFGHFPPWLNWYGLEGAAYQAAAPILAEGLEARVVASGQLDD